MALINANEEYSLGEDVDLDLINQQNLRNIMLEQEKDKLPNPAVDTRNLYGGPSSPTKTGNAARPMEELINLAETPNERFSRLKGELGELKEELQVILEREKDIKIANPETQATLLKEIESMQSQLANIYQNEGIAKLAQGDAANISEGDRELLDLKTNLQYHKAEALLAKIKAVERAGGKAEESIVYNIELKAREESVKKEANLVDLEKRIAKLESIVGNSNIYNLVEEVQKMRRRVETVSKSNMEPVTKKLNQVSQELDVLNQKKTGLELNDPRLIKVEKMYEAYMNLQRISEHLPSVLNRLECLKLIHEESADITDRIKNLKESESKIGKSLEESGVLLNKVEDTFGQHLEKIEKDIKSLQERVEGK